MRLQYSRIFPITTFSESNSLQHWRTKHARAKKQKKLVRLILSADEPSFLLPVKIIVTRLSSRSLDIDNLGGALKYVIDGVADYILPGLAPGRADGDKRISWELKQEKSKEKGVKIEVYAREDETKSPKGLF